MIESLSELSDIFLRVVSDVVYNSPDTLDGEIIEFFGDTVVICMPCELEVKKPPEES